MTMRQKVDDEEKGVLRWGGLAGILGSVVFVLGFVVVGVFVGSNAGLDGDVARFPDIQAARTAENVLYFGALVLWVTHFLALYRALRVTSLAPALFGSSLGVIGLVVLAAGAFPHVAVAPISALFHAPGATTEDKASLVLLWQATLGVFNALLVAGLLLLAIGLVAFGVAMRRAPAFGKGYGGVSVALGVVALAAAVAPLVDPYPFSPITVVGFLALILFHLVLGCKAWRLSRTP